MSTFIGIESIATNALIELLEKQNEREVSFDTLVRSGTRAARIWQEQSNDEAVLLLSRKYQINMIENYSDLFEADLTYNGHGVFRAKGENEHEIVEMLKEHFRWTMGMQLLEAFLSVEALHELGLNI